MTDEDWSTYRNIAEFAHEWNDYYNTEIYDGEYYININFYRLPPSELLNVRQHFLHSISHFDAYEATQLRKILFKGENLFDFADPEDFMFFRPPYSTPENYLNKNTDISLEQDDIDNLLLIDEMFQIRLPSEYISHTNIQRMKMLFLDYARYECIERMKSGIRPSATAQSTALLSFSNLSKP